MTTTIALGMTTVDCGVFEDMPDDEYRAIPALSRSDLDKWATGEVIDDDRKLLIGTVFHMAVLEPRKLKDTLKVGPDVDLRTKDGKAAWEKFIGAPDIDWDKHLCIRASEWRLLKGMVEGMKAHPTISQIRKAEGKREVAVVAKDPSGLFIKGRLDLVTTRSIFDFKSTAYLDAAEFEKSMIDFGYFAQAEWYARLWMLATGELKQVVFVPASKRPPHPCWIRKVTDLELRLGKWINQRMTAIYQKLELPI